MSELPVVLGVAPSGARCIGRGACCKTSPGWFAPGEMERAAEHLGLTPGAFVEKYLVLLSARLEDEPARPQVEAWAPTKVDAQGAPLEGAGRRASRAYRFMQGPCVFYVNLRCAIHPVRPAECRSYFCEQAEELNLSKQQLAREWYAAWRAKQPAGRGGGESGG